MAHSSPISPGQFKKKTNKHFKSSQKLLKSSFVNERFKKYLKVPKELLTFKKTKFAKTVHTYRVAADK